VMGPSDRPHSIGAQCALTGSTKAAMIWPALAVGKEAFDVWFIRSLIALVGIIAFLWVGMSNADQHVDFKFFTRAYPGLSLNILLIAVFGAGMVFSFVIWVLSEFQLRNRIQSYRREVNRLREELAALRSLPLEDTEGSGGNPDLDG